MPRSAFRCRSLELARDRRVTACGFVREKRLAVQVEPRRIVASQKGAVRCLWS
jgi:hypothetical protein